MGPYNRPLSRQLPGDAKHTTRISWPVNTNSPCFHAHWPKSGRCPSSSPSPSLPSPSACERSRRSRAAAREAAARSLTAWSSNQRPGSSAEEEEETRLTTPYQLTSMLGKREVRREEKKEEREEECIHYSVVFAHEERGTRRRNLQEHQGDAGGRGVYSIREI